MLGRRGVLAAVVNGPRELGLRAGDARQQISSLRFEVSPRIHLDHELKTRAYAGTRLVPVVASEA
jgi:hypothetical protein